MFVEVIQATRKAGVNIQGDVPEGNWVFLLPHLNLNQVLCVGEPPANTLKTLQSLAKSVAQVETVESLQEARFDLIYVVDADTGTNWDALARMLAPQGIIYYETRDAQPPSAPAGLHILQSLWLTPTMGRMQTAVPSYDQQTRQYFLGGDIYAPTINMQTFDNLRMWWRKRQGKAVKTSSSNAASPVNHQVKRRKGLKKVVRTVLRKSRNAILTQAQKTEKRLLKMGTTGKIMYRRGVILMPSGSAQNRLPNRLPDYVREIAHEGQIDLSTTRWGFAARGRYNSQKLLFFLFEPQASKPVYVVKMVRDKVFNPRLEREYHGLLRLQQDNLMPAGTLPETVFFGYHHQLAMVGETVIEGEPFESRTSFTSDCPYARQAVKWLIDLSVSTSVDTRSDTGSDEIVNQVQALVDRFIEIYQPTPEHQDFLQAQVQTLRSYPLPLVFQHGDPGSWNLLITPDDKVAFLDWENATLQALPLWDLLYFLRSYCIAAGQKSGDFGNIESFDYLFLQDSKLSPLIVSAVEQYVKQAGLAPELVQPLFYLCWVFWAMKQAAMTEPERLQTAFYWQSLKLALVHKDAPTLKRIFSLKEVGVSSDSIV